MDTWSPDIGASRGTPKVFWCWYYFCYSISLLLLLALVSFLEPLASDPGGAGDLSTRACCHEVKIPNQYGGVIL